MTSWIEINRAALQHNFAQIQNHVGEKVGIIAVVKANAYGCGALICSQIFAKAGAQMLAVTRLDEALELRNAGIQTPILLLSPLGIGEEEAVFEHDLTATIEGGDDLRRLQRLSENLQKKAKIHLKLASGMNRFGASVEHRKSTFEAAIYAKNLEIEAIYTHFPNAQNGEPSETLGEWEEFDTWRHQWPADAPFPKTHSANSAALFSIGALGDFARPGTVLYGQFPSPAIAKIGKQANVELRDPFAVKSRIVALRNLKRGEPIGYGGEWRAKKNAKIAVLALGWADGLSLEPRARMETPLEAIKAGLERAARLQKNPNFGRSVEIQGRKLPLIGRIAMQTCFVDVSGLKNIEIGDVTTVSMRRVTAGAHLKRVLV